MLIKNNKENPDSVAFWYVNDCRVELVNYGKFDRYFVLWTIRNHVPNSAPVQKINEEIKEQLGLGLSSNENSNVFHEFLTS